MEVSEFLKNMAITSSFDQHESNLKDYVGKCAETSPRTIADIGLRFRFILLI